MTLLLNLLEHCSMSMTQSKQPKTIHIKPLKLQGSDSCFLNHGPVSRLSHKLLIEQVI